MLLEIASKPSRDRGPAAGRPRRACCRLPAWFATVVLGLGLVLLVGSLGGCRAIRARTESQPAIAARRLSRQGLEAMHRQRWTNAEELFTDALELNANDDRANWGMAETLWQRGDGDEALEYMERAVRLSGSHPELVVRLGRMQFEQGDYDASWETSQRALRLGRELPETWALRGDCLRQRQRSAEALAAYHRALALRPAYPTVQIEAAELYRQQGRYDRVLATLQRLQETATAEQCPPRAELLRGIAMQRLGRDDEAAACFDRVIRQNPDDLQTQLLRASLALRQQDWGTAQRATREALRIEPTSPLGLELAIQVDQQLRMAQQGAAAEASF